MTEPKDTCQSGIRCPLTRASVLVVALALVVCILGLLRLRSALTPDAVPDTTRNTQTSRVSRQGPAHTGRMPDDALRREAYSAPVRSEPQSISSDGLPAAVLQAMDSPTSGDRDMLLFVLLPMLALRDARLAASLVEHAGPGDEELLLRVAHLWAIQDVDAALVWAGQLPDEAMRKTIVAELCEEWAQKDLAAALGWAGSLKPCPQRDRAFARIADVQSRRAPPEAARTVMEQIPAGPVQTEAVIALLHQWVATDTAGAIDWTESLPPGELRDRAANELLLSRVPGPPDPAQVER